MSMTTHQPGPGSSSRPQPSGLVDVIDTILDKGLVIDAYVRVSLAGIELVTIDARVVVASVDTYLRFAEAVNRLDISHDKKGLTDLAGGGQESGTVRKAKGAAKGALEAAGEVLREFTENQESRSRRTHGMEGR